MERVEAPDRNGTVGDVAAAFCATLFDEWARLGVRHVVVSPGSRSTPLAVAADRNESIQVHMVLDERSAAFVAVGVAHATGKPAVLVCTSGTAAAEYHAGVVEAHQSALPMLVATADRPPELQGVGAPQTIDQRELFGTAVRWYCEPGPPEPQFGLGWRQLARDAMDRATLGIPGAVHLNLAFREPLLGESAELPPPLTTGAERAAIPQHRGVTDEHLVGLRSMIAGRRGLVVAGARAVHDQAEAEATLAAAAALGWPVLADHLSGCRWPQDGVIWHFDPLLRQPRFGVPEVVVHLGASVASKVTNRWLGDSGAVHIGVDRFGLIPDPDQILGTRVHGVPALFLHALASGAEASPPGWFAGWVAADAAARQAIEAEARDEPLIARAVTDLAPAGTLVLSSSMPVRDAEWYGTGRVDLRAVSNRGANGIDGVVSTAIGAALAGEPTTLLIGDLAFLHDVSALTWLRTRNLDLQIVVVDNNGGGIFSFLPPAEELEPERFERLYGTPHGLDLAAIATAYGIPAVRVSTPVELRSRLTSSRPAGPSVVVVESDRSANPASHEALNQAVSLAVADALAQLS